MNDDADLHDRFADYRADVLARLRDALKLRAWDLIAVGLDDDVLVPLLQAWLVELEEAERGGARRVQ